MHKSLGIITIFQDSDVFKIKSSIAYLLYTLTPSMILGFSCRSMISFYSQHLYATKLTLFLFSGVSPETTHLYDTQLLTYIIPCSDDLADFSLTDTDESSIPMDIDQLRERAMKKIARKEAAGLQIGRAHVWTPVTRSSRMPSSAWKKKNSIDSHILLRNNINTEDVAREGKTKDGMQR